MDRFLSFPLSLITESHLDLGSDRFLDSSVCCYRNFDMDCLGKQANPRSELDSILGYAPAYLSRFASPGPVLLDEDIY